MTEEPTQRYVVAVAAVVFREGRLLAMRRSARREAGPGLWETLSGRLQLGESPRDAVLREIAEESGLEVALRPRPVTAYQARRAGEPMVVIVYAADHVTGEVMLSDEHDAFAWLTVEEFAGVSPLVPLVEAARAAAREVARDAPFDSPSAARSPH
ncbi:MAG: NUDIX domain-containing protein [Trueperaceae bacterium]